MGGEKFPAVLIEFLMHRVELKGFLAVFGEERELLKVPNAPCGVESLTFDRDSRTTSTRS